MEKTPIPEMLRVLATLLEGKEDEIDGILVMVRVGDGVIAYVPGHMDDNDVRSIIMRPFTVDRLSREVRH